MLRLREVRRLRQRLHGSMRRVRLHGGGTRMGQYRLPELERGTVRVRKDLLRPRHLHLAPDRALEQVGVAARRPDRHRRALARGLGGQRDGAGAVRLDAHVGDRLVARALELLGQADDRRQQRQPLVVLLARERAELGRVGLALAVVAGDQRDQLELARREAGQPAVQDQVARVLVVVVVVDGGADVVQHAGGPQQLALVGSEHVGQARHAQPVEQLQRQLGDVRRGCSRSSW